MPFLLVKLIESFEISTQVTYGDTNTTIQQSRLCSQQQGLQTYSGDTLLSLVLAVWLN